MPNNLEVKNSSILVCPVSWIVVTKAKIKEKFFIILGNG